jgi:hypothetical protein
MDEALYRAKGGENRSLDITLLHAPPIVMGDVSLTARRSALPEGDG